MKKILLANPAFAGLIASSAFLYAAGLYAQPTNYTVDANAFVGIKFSGGNTQLRLADVDLDGHLDLVTIGDHGNPKLDGTNENGVMIFWGDGTGTNFRPSTGGGYG